MPPSVPRTIYGSVFGCSSSTVGLVIPMGYNHEMARELLWREFPTDQRGTYFSSFWAEAPELVTDMHEIAWRSGAIGSHVKQSLDGQIVFLVRGDLVRRYPGIVAHAALEQGADEAGIAFFAAESPIRTLFHVHLPPNVLLVGFAMTRARIHTPGREVVVYALRESDRAALRPGCITR